MARRRVVWTLLYGTRSSSMARLKRKKDIENFIGQPLAYDNVCKAHFIHGNQNNQAEKTNVWSRFFSFFVCAWFESFCLQHFVPFLCPASVR
jgi:hypothetical protein